MSERALKRGSPEGKEAELGGAAALASTAVLSLKLTNFRNYASAQLALDARPVVLTGENGAGKTNLLEAVSLLGGGQALRGRPLAELARKDGPGGFAIAAHLVTPRGELDAGTGFALGEGGTERRSVRIEGKDASPAALAAEVKIVWLIPAMDGLFTGSASERRRFLDRLVVAINSKMRKCLSHYDRAMRQRNRLFQMREGSGAQFGGLEQEMAEAGTAIAAARLDGVARLSDLIDRARSARGDGPFPFALLAVEGKLEAGLLERPATEVEDDFRRRLDANRERDRAACRALEGPHLSDLKVRHGPSDAPAENCSSGEQKALLIGLVLAKAELIKELEGSSPLVLLDEIAAHLDQRRREALFAELLRLGPQAWMTGTDRELFAPLADAAQYVLVSDARAVRCN